MEVSTTPIDGVLVIEPRVFGDHRGFFTEYWSQPRYAEVVRHEQFVQDNLSCSRKGVLRGVHVQNPNPQGNLVYVLYGEVFDLVVDIHLGSPTFGQWYGVTLSVENRKRFYTCRPCAPSSL